MWNVVKAQIRKAQRKDFEGLVKVELGSGYHKTKFNPRPMFDKIFLEKKEILFVCEVGGKIVGYIGVNFHDEECEVVLLAILEKYQRRGFAKKLILKVIKECRKNNIKKIVLDVRNDNLKALYLYLNYGFIVEDIQRKAKLTKLRMIKILK